MKLSVNLDWVTRWLNCIESAWTTHILGHSMLSTSMNQVVGCPLLRNYIFKGNIKLNCNVYL